MKYCLVTPTEFTEYSNSGWHFITAGIRHLIKLADPEAVFGDVSFFDESKWPRDLIFSKYDWIVICGNPRYDGTELDDWLYYGMLSRIMKIKNRINISVLDAWQGAGAPLGKSTSENVEMLAAKQRNRNIVQLLKDMDAKVISRCPTSHELNNYLGLKSEYMPCSSYWGVKEFRVPKYNPYKKIVIPYRMHGFEGAKGILRTLSRTHQVISTNAYDAEFCCDIGVSSPLVTNPEALLVLYSQCEEVISFRLHAAIPAASIGCAVHYLAIDSRGEVCEPFGISCSDYRDGVTETSQAVPPPAPDLRKILGVM